MQQSEFEMHWPAVFILKEERKQLSERQICYAEGSQHYLWMILKAKKKQKPKQNRQRVFLQAVISSTSRGDNRSVLTKFALWCFSLESFICLLPDVQRRRHSPHFPSFSRVWFRYSLHTGSSCKIKSITLHEAEICPRVDTDPWDGHVTLKSSSWLQTIVIFKTRAGSCFL